MGLFPKVVQPCDAAQVVHCSSGRDHNEKPPSVLDVRSLLGPAMPAMALLGFCGGPLVACPNDIVLAGSPHATSTCISFGFMVFITMAKTSASVLRSNASRPFPCRSFIFIFFNWGKGSDADSVSLQGLHVVSYQARSTWQLRVRSLFWI